MENIVYTLEQLTSLRTLGKLSDVDFEQQKQVLTHQGQNTTDDKRINRVLMAALIVGIALTWTLYLSAKEVVEHAVDRKEQAKQSPVDR